MAHLRGEQYVRIAPGAIHVVAEYLHVPQGSIVELALEVASWPDDVAVPERKAADGRCILGDPLLTGIQPAGLLFAGRHGSPVLVRWREIRSVRVLRGRERTQPA